MVIYTFKQKWKQIFKDDSSTGVFTIFVLCVIIIKVLTCVMNEDNFGASLSAKINNCNFLFQVSKNKMNKYNAWMKCS